MTEDQRPEVVDMTEEQGRVVDLFVYGLTLLTPDPIPSGG
jgi:hypothetical protein